MTGRRPYGLPANQADDAVHPLKLAAQYEKRNWAAPAYSEFFELERQGLIIAKRRGWGFYDVQLTNAGVRALKEIDNHE